MSAIYNFAFLDENTKRMLRRGLLKAVAHRNQKEEEGDPECVSGGSRKTSAIHRTPWRA